MINIFSSHYIQSEINYQSTPNLTSTNQTRLILTHALNNLWLRAWKLASSHHLLLLLSQSRNMSISASHTILVVIQVPVGRVTYKRWDKSAFICQ